MRLLIPDIAPSSNAFYSGLHRFQRSKLANQWHAKVVALCKEQRLGKWKRNFPVKIHVECRFGKSKRVMDCDNLQATAKMAIDGLVHAGVLPDDNPRYVQEVSLRSLKTGEAGNLTIVTIEEA